MTMDDLQGYPHFRKPPILISFLQKCWWHALKACYTFVSLDTDDYIEDMLRKNSIVHREKTSDIAMIVSLLQPSVQAWEWAVLASLKELALVFGASDLSL